MFESKLLNRKLGNYFEHYGIDNAHRSHGSNHCFQKIISVYVWVRPKSTRNKICITHVREDRLQFSLINHVVTSFYPPFHSTGPDEMNSEDAVNHQGLFKFSSV